MSGLRGRKFPDPYFAPAEGAPRVEFDVDEYFFDGTELTFIDPDGSSLIEITSAAENELRTRVVLISPSGGRAPKLVSTGNTVSVDAGSGTYNVEVYVAHTLTTLAVVALDTNVTCTARVHLNIQTTGGHVHLVRPRHVTVSTHSGHVYVGDVGGDVAVQTESGDVEVRYGYADAVNVTSTDGSIAVHGVAIGRELKAATVHGGVHVTVFPRAPEIKLAGSATSVNGKHTVEGVNNTPGGERNIVVSSVYGNTSVHIA